MKKAHRTSPIASQQGMAHLVDAALDCSVNVETFMELLKGYEKTERMERKVVTNTASLVLQENKKLRHLLNHFRSHLPKS